MKSIEQTFVVLNSVGMMVKGTSCEYKHEAKIIRDAMNINAEKGKLYTIGIATDHDNKLNE